MEGSLNGSPGVYGRKHLFVAGRSERPTRSAQSGPLTKIIFPFAAGGSGDTLCRLLAQHIGPLLDRTIIVENRTGGDGLIGIKSVKGANPDGDHDTGDHRADHVPAADGGGQAELRSREGFHAGVAAGAI